MTPAEHQLRQEAYRVFTDRWHFVADMNNDGAVTISDVWLWFKWVFFAPGDAFLLAVMHQAPGIALFLELSLRSVSGVVSGIISCGLWWLVLSAISERAFREPAR